MFTRELMVRVHEIARELEGDYSARLALAFRIVKTEVTPLEGLKNIKSAKVWSNYGKERIYIQLNCVSKNQNNQKDYYIERTGNEWVAPNYNLEYYIKDVLEAINGKDLNAVKNIMGL